MAVSYILAVLVSVLVSITVASAICLLLLGNQKSTPRTSPLLVWLQRGYESVLSQTIQRGRIGFIILLGLTVVSLAILPSLNKSLLPSFKERNLLIHTFRKHRCHKADDCPADDNRQNPAIPIHGRTFAAPRWRPQDINPIDRWGIGEQRQIQRYADQV